MKKTPGETIRDFCKECAGSAYQTAECCGHQLLTGGNPKGACRFYPYRQGNGRPSMKVIRKHCLECMGGLVAECWSPECPVWPYRFGRRPKAEDLILSTYALEIGKRLPEGIREYLAPELTEAQRVVLDRMKTSREPACLGLFGHEKSTRAA